MQSIRTKISDALIEMRKHYIQEGYAPTVYDINNGECENIAEDTLEKIEEKYGKEFLQAHCIESLTYGNLSGKLDEDVNDFVIYEGTLNELNIPLPTRFSIAEANNAHMTSHGDHYYLRANIDGSDIYFDTINTEGVSSPFELDVTKYWVFVKNTRLDEAEQIMKKMKSIQP